MANLGPLFLAATDEDDIAILLAASEVAADIRDEEAKRSARHIADGTRQVLGG